MVVGVGSAPVPHRSRRRPRHAGARPHSRELLHAGRDSGLAPARSRRASSRSPFSALPMSARRSAVRSSRSPWLRPTPRRAIGLTFGQMLVYVLVPQAIRQIAPNFVNTAVEIVKASSLLSAIGVGRASPHDPGDHRPHLQDDGVLRAVPAASILLINLVIGTGGCVARTPFPPTRRAGSIGTDPHDQGPTKTFGAHSRPARCRSRCFAR